MAPKLSAAAKKSVNRPKPKASSGKTLTFDQQVELAKLNHQLEIEASDKAAKLFADQKEQEARLTLELKVKELEILAEQKTVDSARELEFLKEKQEFEFSLKRMELENTLKQCEISHQNPTAESNSENSSNWSGSKFNLGLGKFNNQGLELEAHLHRFELVATSYNLPKHLWPVELSKSLTGIALETFDRLDTESQHQYELVVKALQALQKTFNITESTYRKLF